MLFKLIVLNTVEELRKMILFFLRCCVFYVMALNHLQLMLSATLTENGASCQPFDSKKFTRCKCTHVYHSRQQKRNLTQSTWTVPCRGKAHRQTPASVPTWRARKSSTPLAVIPSRLPIVCLRFDHVVFKIPPLYLFFQLFRIFTSFYRSASGE